MAALWCSHNKDQLNGGTCRQTLPDWGSNLLSRSRSLAVERSITPLSSCLAYTAGMLQSMPIANDPFQQHALEGTTRAQDLLELACKTHMTYRAWNSELLQEEGCECACCE